MIEILVGMIASGKSTYCKQEAKRGAIIINDDAIVTAIHGGNYNLYTEQLKPLYKSVEDHILHSAILLGKDVIIDRGLNLRRQSRARWISLAKSLEVPVFARVFKIESPETHAKRRVKADARGASYEGWLDVAREHLEQYEEPTLEEGFNYVTYHGASPVASQFIESHH